MSLRRGILALAAAATLLLPVAPASAATIDVTYGLSGGFLVGGTTPMGTGGTGTMTLRYQATFPSTIQPGPVAVVSFNFGPQTFNIPSIFGVTNAAMTGAVGFQINGGAGIYGGGNLSLLHTNGLQTGFIHCQNATACGVLGLGAFLVTQPLGITTAVSPTAPVPMSGPAVATPATATLRIPTTLLATFLGVPGTWTFVGTEISRTVIPEPTTLPLLALGAGGVLGAGWIARRSRRS